MSAGKRTREAAYDRTGYANVADKFVICVQREGSFSITTEDCRNLLALISERDALREALELIAAHTSNCIEQCRAENNASLLRVHATVVSVQIMARKALAIVDGAK